MGRKDFIIKRLFHSIIVLIIVILINFGLPRLMPGDPTRYFTDDPRLTEEARQIILRQFGLDKPLWEQFVSYLANLFRGNFGLSFFYYPTPVWDLLMQRMPWTIFLVLSAHVLGYIFGTILGVIAAWKRGSKTDVTILSTSLFLTSMPIFWLGMSFLLLFGYYIPIFPLGGALTSGATYDNAFYFLADVFKHAVLPIITLSLIYLASPAFTMRNTMLDVMGEDYIIAAYAKGVPEQKIKYRHAARNAMLPVVTGAILSLSYMVGGAVLTETVFSYPGVGRLIYTAILSRDYPVLQGAFFLIGVSVVVGNFLADMLYAWLDPRVKV